MEENIKDTIVNTTFRLLEKKDMNSISIREITKEANVNVAAINYYFGGKAELFAYMMELYWNDLVKLCEDILNDESLDKSKARLYCERYIRKEIASTGILRSEQIMYQNYSIDEKTKQRIELQYKAMRKLITKCNPDIDESKIIIEITSLLSSLTHPALWNEIIDSIAGNREKFITEYVDYLVEKL